MKRTLIIFILSLNVFVNAQGVDLPEFVIEGVQKVSLPVIEKSAPGFVKPLSESYFKYKFKPEDFDVSFKTKDTLVIARTFVRGKKYSGRADAAFGLQAQPKGSFFASYVNDNFEATLSANGKAVRSYEPYSAYLLGGGKFSARYFTEHADDFLPFTSVGITGEGNYYDGKFWASETPEFQRKATFGAGNALFYHFSPDKYAVALNLGGNFMHLLKENFTERVFNASGMFEYDFSPFKLSFDGKFVSHSVLLPVYEKSRYYAASAKTEIAMNKSVFVNFGALFATDENENFFYPMLGIKVNLSDYFMLFAQVQGGSDYLTNYRLARRNPYFYGTDGKGIFMREANKIDIGARFNYSTKINAELSAHYGVTDNFYYYDDSAKRGFFDVRTASDVTLFALDFDADLLFSKYGFLSFQTRFQTRRLENWNVAPYSPEISADAMYSFVFSEKFSFALGANYFSGFYTDIQNRTKTEPFANLYAKGKYLLFDGLKLTAELNNILNKNNFYFPGYKSAPFDILIGAEYFWK